MLARGVVMVMMTAGLTATLLTRGGVFYETWVRASEEKVNDDWFIERCKNAEFSRHLENVCKRVGVKESPVMQALRAASQCPCQSHMRPWLVVAALVPGTLSLLEWTIWRLCRSRRVYKDPIHAA